MEKRHRWLFNEDKYCCEKYIEYYVLNKSGLKIDMFVELLKAALPEIKKNSLKMKVSNIKQILIELGIDDTLDVKPLKNYSRQNKVAMLKVLSEKGLN